MGLLNYIDEEPSLFGGMLRGGYDPALVPPQSAQGDDDAPRFQPPTPIEASLVDQSRSALPRVVIPTNNLPVVNVTADQPPPAASEGSSALGVAKALGSGAVKGAAQYYKGTDQEKYARMIGAFLGGGGAGLATAAHAGLPNGVRGALYSSLFRGAMKAKTAEGLDAQRRSERDAH